MTKLPPVFALFNFYLRSQLYTDINNVFVTRRVSCFIIFEISPLFCICLLSFFFFSLSFITSYPFILFPSIFLLTHTLSPFVFPLFFFFFFLFSN
eukprot:UN04274